MTADLASAALDITACRGASAWSGAASRGRRTPRDSPVRLLGPAGAGWRSAARLLVVGLAPAAHGGNRTGRVFTGESLGDWLYGGPPPSRVCQPAASLRRSDGLALSGATSRAWCAARARQQADAKERDRCVGLI